MTKPTAGSVATANRLETLPTVQNTLKNVGDNAQLSFLEGSAATAIEILHMIQSEDRDLDDEFVNLALDTCGLMYLVIRQCLEDFHRRGSISTDRKQDAVQLETDIKAAQKFFQKKVNASLARRMNIRKRHEDKQKITEYRSCFRRWMFSFASGEQGSIHATLQAVIDKQIQESEQQAAAAARKSKATDRASVEASITRLQSNMENLHVRNDSGSCTHLHTPLAQMTMPEPVSNPLPPDITVSDAPVPPPVRPLGVAMPETTLDTGSNGAQSHRADQWNAIRRPEAEKERFRKSEQEFANLPPATPDDDERPSRLSQQYPSSMRSETPVSRPPSRDDDVAILRALRNRYPELDQDQLHAMLMDGRAELRLEEEQKRSATKRPGIIENKARPVADEKIYRRSPSQYSSPSPVSANSQQGNSSRSSPFPNATSQSSSPGFSPHGSMNFQDIKYSGISLGGGPVHVRNTNTGNTTTITYHDSMNDNSVRNYYR